VDVHLNNMYEYLAFSAVRFLTYFTFKFIDVGGVDTLTVAGEAELVPVGVLSYEVVDCDVAELIPGCLIKQVY